MTGSNLCVSTLASPASAGAGQVRLRVLEGSSRGREIVLGEGSHRLGRWTGSPLPVDPAVDTLVSRVHAEVRVEGGRCGLADSGSTNGTFRNGEPVVGEAELRPDDEISLGPADREGAVQFTVHFAAAEEAAPAPRSPRVRLSPGGAAGVAMEGAFVGAEPGGGAGAEIGLGRWDEHGAANGAGALLGGVLGRARAVLNRGLAPFLLPRLERAERELRAEAERALGGLGERLVSGGAAGLAGWEAAAAAVRATEASASKRATAAAELQKCGSLHAAWAERHEARLRGLGADVDDARRAVEEAGGELGAARRRVADVLAGRIAAMEGAASIAQGVAALMGNCPAEGLEARASQSAAELRRHVKELEAPWPDLREEVAGVAGAESAVREAEARAAEAQDAAARAEAEGAGVRAEHERRRGALAAASAAAEEEHRARSAERRLAMAELGRKAVEAGRAEGADGREAAEVWGRLREATEKIARLRGGADVPR